MFRRHETVSPLLAAVRARADAWERARDADAVLTVDADLEASRLIRELPGRGGLGATGEAYVLAVGRLHWCQFEALTARGEHERAATPYEAALSQLCLFDTSRRGRSRGELPPPVAALFDRTPEARRDPRRAAAVAGQAMADVAAQGIPEAERGSLPLPVSPPGRDPRTVLDHAADTLDHAMAALTAYTPEHGIASLLLCSALVMRQDHGTPRPADLDRAVALLRSLAPPSGAHADPVQVDRLLGHALSLRGQRDDDPADLDEAIVLLRAAIDALPPDHFSVPERWSLLARAHYARYLAAPDDDALDSAITAVRSAVRVSGLLGHADRARRLAELSEMLLRRHQRTSDRAAADEALAAAREATATAADEATRRRVAGALGRALLTRYAYDPHAAHLTEAVRLLRDTVPEGPTADHLDDLAVALLHLHRHRAATGTAVTDTPELDEATALLRAAAALPSTPAARTNILINTGAALKERHLLTGDRDLLAEITDTYRTAAEGTARPGTRCAALLNLGLILGERATDHGEPGLLPEAVATLRALTATEEAEPELRLSAGRNWGKWAASAGDWATAAEGYARAVAVLPELAPAHLRAADRAELLSGRLQVTRDAAAAALHAGQDARALELLEHGRAILLTTALELDRETTDLRAVAPGLADTLERVRDALNSRLDDPDRRHRLGAERRNAVARVRALPGFADFLRPPTADRLAAHTTAGPVVTVNVSEHRCDALVLDATGLRVVPLTALRPAELDDRARRFARDTAAAHDPAVRRPARVEAQESLRDTLAWLWDTVAGPVLDALGYAAPPPDGTPWPRVWWSPTGALAALPLHAAGHHDGDRAVLDRVVSSYTPTIRAARAVPRAADGTWLPALVVAVPEAPGARPLPGALAEAAFVTGEIGGRVLTGREATRERVLSLLRAGGLAHFACHAHLDPARPAVGHLVLDDGPLLISDIHRLRVRDAELAFLSACSTGLGTDDLADEAVHLGSAFRLAGFRHAVATLWQVQDSAADRLARDFYTARRAHGDTALALHEAVRTAREVTPRLVTRWAAHVHTGVQER
ncbi:CHAT domain-containing protein [Streptomyces sp. MS19]|uniref:CHAT domain-containing protein n=1 Tax=Streptomyces sp. MS19 TaxID=3385972 RepID=UPI0039A058C7